jgi:hypothetical protein
MKETDVIELQPHELLAGLVDVIRETESKIGYYDVKSMAKKHLDNVLTETLKKKPLSESQILALAQKLYTDIMVRSTIQGLSLLSGYQAAAKSMTPSEFKGEPHKSKRLSRHMKATGLKRPPNVAAHAIVSGDKPEAKAARKILAKWKIRIDDPDNGVFLPRDVRFIPHPDLPDAANHAMVHSDEYYVNITAMLEQTTSPSSCREVLRLIAKELTEGTLQY